MADIETSPLGEPQLIDLSRPILDELYPLLTELRSQGPVVPVSLFGQPAYLLTSHAANEEALADEDRFGALGGPQHDDPYIGRVMTSYDYEEHRLHRQLTARALRAREILQATEGLAHSVADRLIDSLDDGVEIDLMEDYVIPFSYRVITRLIGVDEADEKQVADLGWDLIEIGADPERAAAASLELGRRFGSLVDGAREMDPSTLVWQLAESRVNGQGLEREDIVSFCRLMFGNGADSTSHALGILLAFALDNPHVYASAPVHAVLTECLRWETPVPAVIRQCRRDTVFSGTEIPGGSIVLFGIGGANRDPERFERPDEFDAGRGSTPMLTFGPGGPHHCTGIPHARTMITVGARSLLERCVVTVSDRHESAMATLVGGLVRGPEHLRVRVNRR